MPDTLQSLLTEAQKAGELQATRSFDWNRDNSAFTDQERLVLADAMAVELLTRIVERDRMLRVAIMEPPPERSMYLSRNWPSYIADLKARSQEVGT